MKCEMNVCTSNQSICIVSFFSLPLPRTSIATPVVVLLLLVVVLLGIYIVCADAIKCRYEISLTHTQSF